MAVSAVPEASAASGTPGGATAAAGKARGRRQGWDVPSDFEAFAAARWSRLVRTAHLITGDHHEAEDLVQMTLAKVYPHWGRISGLDSPDAYLHRALVNNSLTRHRMRRARQLLMPWVPERPQAAETARVEQRSLLTQALAELPPRQRVVVVLRYWEDLSEQQVAEAIGCSVGNVKSQASRGLAKLRAHPALAEYVRGGGAGREE
jgi:RNA polymerase sigma-70 factor (sigma-E family)